jgi:hypothetical protein
MRILMVRILALAVCLCFVSVASVCTKIGQDKVSICAEDLIHLAELAHKGINSLQGWWSMRPVPTPVVPVQPDGLGTCSQGSVCRSINDTLAVASVRPGACWDASNCTPFDDTVIVGTSVDDDLDACSDCYTRKGFNKTVYDAIVRFTNLTDLQKRGLDVIVSDSAVLSLSGETKELPAEGEPSQKRSMTWMDFDQKFFKGVVIVVDGLYDVGKSFFFSRFCGLNLPRGMAQHTEGFSIKAVLHRFFQYIIMDNAGFGAPSRIFTPEAIALQKVGEEMITRVAHKVADVFIKVIGRLSSDDQVSVIKMAQDVMAQLSNKKDKDDTEKAFFVLVHNPRLNAESFRQFFMSEVRPAFPGSVCVEVEHRHQSELARRLGRDLSKPICDDYGLGDFVMFSKIYDTEILHYFILDEGGEDGVPLRETEIFVNDIAFEDLKARINKKVPVEYFNKQQPLLSNILRAMETFLSKYIICNRSISDNECAADEGSDTLHLNVVPSSNSTVLENANVMNLRLNGEYTIAKGISDGITQQYIPLPSPTVPWRIYQKEIDVTPRKSMMGKAASAAATMITQMVFRMEIAGLKNDSAVEISVGRDKVIVTYEKTADSLQEAEGFKLVYSDLKVGIFQQVIPVDNIDMVLSQRDVLHCIDDGVLHIILNNANNNATTAVMNCDALRAQLKPGKEGPVEVLKGLGIHYIGVLRAALQRLS